MFNLINTADERTWSKNQKNLFLGEWCLKHSRKHIWKNLDFEMCDVISKSKKEKNSSVKEVFYLTKKFLPQITKALNDYNKTNFSERYWEILIGHWLIRFVATISNRYYTLKSALDNYDISSTTFLKSPNYKIATLDTLSSIYSTNCEIWNNMIFLKLFNYLSTKDIKINLVDIDDKYFLYNHLNIKKKTIKQNINHIIVKLISKITKDNDAVIHSSYLSLVDEIKLNLFFYQLPFQCMENGYKLNFNYEREDIKLFPKNSKTCLFQFLNSIIFSAIPSIYIENFLKLQEKISELNWPKNPKFIFTSNSFDTNEIFKGWVGRNINKSVPYFTGQHGNNYGQHVFEGRSNWPERSTSDGFLTWGWDDGFKTNLKGFNFKKQIRRPNIYKNDGIVLITTCVMFRYFPWDVVSEYKDNLKEQYNFLENLSEDIFGKVTVRLHHSSSVKDNIDQFGEKENLKDRFPNIKIDDGKTKLQSIVNKNKLFVFSYDGTGILEFLNSNIPFIAFWPDQTNHLIDDDEVSNLYNEFYKVGIFFKNGNDAAKSLNKSWHLIEIWWNSNEVVLAKEKFKQRFSVCKINPKHNVGKILNNLIKNGK